MKPMRLSIKLGVGIVLVVAIGFAVFKAFIGVPRPHNPRVFGPPELTQWKPVGARSVGQHGYDIIPEPTTWHAIHADVVNSDSVWGVAAPMFVADWVSEPGFFIGNGPTFDNAGNLYFSANVYKGERVPLVALDAQTGKRRWAIAPDSDREEMSPAFVLNDPDHPGSQIVYVASYTRAMALRPDGTTVWSTPTGLTLPPLERGKNPHVRVLSLNYHPPTDSLVTVSQAGKLFAFDRKSGKLIAPIGQIPGAPAISGNGTKVPGFIIKKVDPLMDAAFGKAEGGRSLFSGALNYIYGGGGVVTNFFSIAPDTGRIYMAATAEDEADGKKDGQSEVGAIYALDLVPDGKGAFAFKVLSRATFKGGTASTPALSADGSRVYETDNEGNLLALDRDLKELWRVNVGEPVIASVTVSPDNSELYVVTRQDVIKLVDKGSSGAVEWKAKLTGFDGYANVEKQSNCLTATVTANGVVICIGGGKSVFGNNIFLHMGMGLLDRKTGELRYFAEGREESIAMSTVAADGSIYIAHSPMRRAVGKALYPELTKDIIGGIQRYKPIRLDLLARDAICAAEARGANAGTLDPATQQAAIATDIRQMKVLLKQAGSAITKAVGDGDMSAEMAGTLNGLLEQGVATLAPATLPQAVSKLTEACAKFSR